MTKSKYLKGAIVPTGNTQFKFKVGDLDFNSTEYDWLVIAGQKALFKGTGTINGEGTYKFMISAIEGTTGEGKFRIKIWDGLSDEIIYDNQLGVDEDADPTTTIVGSIRIQKD